MLFFTKWILKCGLFLLNKRQTYSTALKFVNFHHISLLVMLIYCLFTQRVFVIYLWEYGTCVITLLVLFKILVLTQDDDSMKECDWSSRSISSGTCGTFVNSSNTNLSWQQHRQQQPHTNLNPPPTPCSCCMPSQIQIKE